MSNLLNSNFLTILLCILFILASVLTSTLGLWFTRRFVSRDKIKLSNNVTGATINIIGVLYAVLLGFVVIAVWEDHESTHEAVIMEANILGDIYRDSKALSGESQKDIQQKTINYTESVLKYEWVSMEEDKECLRAKEAYNGLCSQIMTFNPVTEREKIVFASILNQFNELSNYRRIRLLGCHAHVPAFIWTILILGGMITVSFTYFFVIENVKMQIFMTGMLAAMISLILFLGYVLDNPFKGATKISPEPFENLIETFTSI